ncbi:amidophosphoribosyltransferase [Thiohalorhabdus denitrificans]|uniref:Amidophosphoribosyltransferase n=1 Tax=Thiohalorhabdus denitrificans TaxID=381306 RepID=A0A0P9GJZ9_9GAMM|nr:amidophosphoribosyltransferase [Thiohalorhabdus denitrificans]KPV40442.1 amidophosphoribosyltransferase [Thiohalorhabdus denitrificans]SCY60929.1 amidophosphoribosyltransferase [Thiohalorhabdus denitrificans]
MNHAVTIDDDAFHHECGVCGVFGHEEAANLTYLGLYALQHRGQEAAGVTSCDGTLFHTHRGMGRVADVFGAEDMDRLKGRHAIGHVRYSTSGASVERNAQPLVIDYQHGGLGMAHNGNLVNAAQLRQDLERQGSIFQTEMDTEVIIHLVARALGTSVEERLANALREVRGAYTLVALTESRLVGARDPLGFRPLVLGEIDGAYVLASETCALDLIGAELIRDIEPGEMVVITRDGVRSLFPFEPQPRRMCVFEYMYFARPDSTLDGINVYNARKAIGRELAREHPVEADVVVPVPDSGVAAAMGYAEESGLPLELGLIRNHYVGRTFIEPKQAIRHFGVKVKLNAVRDVLKGKRVILVDDSIVRGTTSAKIVGMVKAAGAEEVHMRISAPPTIGPCHYGIDTPDRDQLIAATHTQEQIRSSLGCETLAYLSLDGLYRGMGGRAPGYCDACFSDDYPVAPEGKVQQMSLLREEAG